MAEEVKRNIDSAELVAKRIIQSIIRDHKEKHLGFPESLFVRINEVLPGIVDMDMRSQNKIAKNYLQ